MQSIVLADGRTLAYHAWGPADGPLLLHCHGVPGSRLELTAVADALAAGAARIVVPDRPGIGFSSGPAPDRPLTLTGYADDLVQLADALGAERFAVSGLSAGGAYALAAAAARPDRVRAVFLLSGAGDPATPGAEDGVFPGERLMGWLAETHPAVAEGFWRAARAVIRRHPILTTRGILRAAPADALFFDDERSRAVARALEESMRQGAAAMVADYARSYEPWDFDPAAIGVPVRAWHGEADRIVPIRLIEELGERIPTLALVRLPATGHMGVLRVTGDVLAAAAD